MYYLNKHSTRTAYKK